MNAKPNVFFTILVICLIVRIPLFAQSSANQENREVYRSRSPFALKLGLEGVGIDLTLGKSIAFSGTSFLFYNSGKAKILLLPRNGTPFIGIGIGGATGAGGGERSWIVLCGGWQQDYERLFIQLTGQVTLSVSPSYAKSAFPVNVEIGWRL